MRAVQGALNIASQRVPRRRTRRLRNPPAPAHEQFQLPAILPRHATIPGSPSSQYLATGLLLVFVYVASEEELMADNPFEIPQQMRDLAEQNIKQAHAA